jgi:hypothetical protein
MDDIDAGTDSIADAKRLLRDADLILQSRNLRLNSGKTQILSAEDARWHFRTRHNRRIDAIEKILEKIDETSPPSKQVTRLAAAARSMMKKGEFDDGNGEKILKRDLEYLHSVWSKNSCGNILRLYSPKTEPP